MKQFLDQHVSRLATVVIAVMLALVPFHAFLTVSGSNIVGHYTALRLWEEVLLAGLTFAAVYLCVRDKKLLKSLSSSWLWRLIAVYALINLIWAAFHLSSNDVSLKAAAYGVLVNLRYLLFFWIVYVVATNYGWLRRSWQKLVMIPAVIVVGFGLLQRFVLPHDFLKHFGYGDDTIPAFATIDHKVEYLRIQSTLRGANFLGAYMIMILSLVATVFKKWRLIAGLAIGLIVLFLSGSRGAWVGTVAALLSLLALSLPTRKAKLIAASAGLALVLVGAGGVWVLRDYDPVQNAVFHTDENSRATESSNEAHFEATAGALKQVLHEPLGRGPGTAGPASFHNTEQPERIAENYFLQIAQETGWIGILVFFAIYVLTGLELWRRRYDALARGLFASLIGLTCMAMLMHVWVDETIAFLFWGLAGIAISIKPERVKS